MSVPVGRWSAAVVVGVALFAAAFAVVGADLMWLVATGEAVLRTRAIPDGVPFAAAPSSGWTNVPVLAEVLLAAVHEATGVAGLVVLHVGLVLAALVTLAVGARTGTAAPEGPSDGAVAVSVAVAALGSLGALVVLRAEVLSLLPYALLLVLLRRDHREPGRTIWWALPLVVVWANLHGAVLVGIAVSGCYLAFSRLRVRPAETIVLGLALLAAVLVTPALLDTPRYYLGVLTNVAAEEGVGLWGSLDLTQPLDLLLVAAALALAIAAARSRPPLWELVAAGGLAVGTLLTARHGLWLVLMLVGPAALGLSRRGRGARDAARPPQVPVPGTGRLVAAAVGAIALAAAPLALAAYRGTSLRPVHPELLTAVREVADGRVVLAPAPLAEWLAADGARVWVTNPIDAFAKADQRAYLDFQYRDVLDGPAVAASDVVVVRGAVNEGALRGAGLSEVATVGDWAVWSRD